VRRSRFGMALASALAVTSVLSIDLGAQARPEPNRGGALDLASLDPAVALERMQIADGYAVSLFASEKEFPEVANPLAMTFDARGRLWVLTSPTYPHYVPGDPPDDKLVILEDTNQDGRADKLKVFADKLYIPTGFELGDGGVYIAQQPNLMFMRDTNGDDKADERRIILHGFGTEDSHHSIHAFTWDNGGGLHFQEGTFLHSQVETPYGPVRLEEAGVWRYEPRTEKLSVFVSYGFANPWGHVVDRWGQNFISDASNGNNYFGTAFSGQVPYPTKQPAMQTWVPTTMRPTCNIELVTSRHFPESAQGEFLLTNVIGFNGIKRFKSREEGSGFAGTEIGPLLYSSDPNFRPVASQFGPDGALYVIDWFNPLIGHMQYSIRDPRRDHTHGRVWRITAKGRPLSTPVRIEGQSIAAQLDLLKVYEDRVRYRVRRALRDRPTKEVVAALGPWIAGLSATDADYEHHLTEALWLYQQHDVVEPALLKRLLEAKDYRARAAAVRVLQHWFDRIDGAPALVRRMVQDPAPRVRLEAVRALSFVPTVASAEAALEVLRAPMDYYLHYVLESTMTTLQPVWKPALSTQRFASENPAGLAFVLERLPSAELAALPRSRPVFDALLTRPGIERKHRQDAIEALVRTNNSDAPKEILAALHKVDGVPGGTAAATDLAALLAAADAGSLIKHRAALQGLATSGQSEVVRQAGFAALLRAEDVVDRVWTLAASSPRSQIDLVNSTSMIEDAVLRDRLFAPMAKLLQEAGGASAKKVEPARSGRYVRIVLPGRSRALRLAEVQVFSGGENVALKGQATQSSTASGGASGQAARALDGKLENDPASVTLTSAEQNPWWEIDLGAERPIDTVVVWNARGGGRDAGLHVSLLNASRQPVFVRDAVSTSAPTEVVAVGGDLTSRLTIAAMNALAGLRTHEAETFGLLSGLMKAGPVRYAAVAAIRQIPQTAWPQPLLAPLADDLITYARGVPAANRTGAAFRQAIELGRDVAARLPDTDRTRVASALDALVMRTIRIEAVRAQMKFDISHIQLVAGEEVEIEFVNADEMPHNLLITSPGAMETVSLAAEAMAKDPSAFAKHFVPESKDVLFSTPLVAPGESVRLRFTAPTKPDGYPFVCTFPGHWRTMNGTVEVTRAAPTSSAP
jgi:azurin